MGSTRPHTSNPERWQSGRMRRTRNPVYRSPVPWVRIPPSPPPIKPKRLFLLGFFVSGRVGVHKSVIKNAGEASSCRGCEGSNLGPPQALRSQSQPAARSGFVDQSARSSVANCCAGIHTGPSGTCSNGTLGVESSPPDIDRIFLVLLLVGVGQDCSADLRSRVRSTETPACCNAAASIRRVLFILMNRYQPPADPRL